MSLQFILGGSGCGKTYFMQHLVLEEARKHPEKKYIFLVPEQFTMQTQKELVSMSTEHGILNIEVQSFIRLAFRIFSETGANRMPVLDDLGKTMVLKKVLSGIEEQLSYFGKNVRKNGYVQEIKSFLSELYQYHAVEETMEQMIVTATDRPILKRKLQDMKTIYEGFSAYLKEHYITSEEVMDVLANVTVKSQILKDSVVFLDGFTGFTPTQYEFLKQLFHIAEKIYVSVTMDKRELMEKPGPKHGLFYLSQKTMYRMRRIAHETGTTVCKDIWTGLKEEETRFFRAKGIRFLERELFRYSKAYDKEKPQDISIHILPNPEQEIAFVIEKIRTLLYDNNCRYREIAVVTGDLQTYGMIAKDEFAKAGIPCFVDQKKGIEEHPFVDLIQSVIEIFLSNFRIESVMQFEKNLFSTASKEQSSLLDNFLRATGTRGYRKWKEEWDGSILFGEMEVKGKEEKKRQLDLIRIETLDQIGTLYEEIGKGKHTVREFSKAFCEWMAAERYYDKIEQQVQEFESSNEKALAWEYRQIYQIVLGVFDRLVELLGKEKMTLREFKEILSMGFSEARIGLIPPGIDQVLIGDMNRSRLAHIKHLFFIGVNDGIIPQSSSKGGVISDAERQFLSDKEFELAPTIRESLYTEQFYLYLNLTKPTEHLYLTCHETGMDGNAKKPAYIIDRICHLFPQLIPVVEENRTDDRYLLGNAFGRDYLIAGLRNRRYAEKKWQEIFQFYQREPERKQKVDDWIAAAFYREMQGTLSKNAIHGLYHEILSGSTSQFEQYAACAFAYFMRYGLHLQERKEHQVAFFDIGNIAHAAIELYTKQMLTEGKNWTDIDEEEQNKRVERCVEDAASHYKNGLLMQTERDSYLVSRLKRLVGRTVWAIKKQMEQGSFQTITSEFNFEILEKQEGNFVTSEQEDSTTEQEKGLLRLIGRIDRMDGMTKGEELYLSIVDYKTGQKDLSLSELYHGLQMQLIIYLKAGMEQKQAETQKIVIPAGVLYYHVADPMVSKQNGESEAETELRILQELKMGGLLNMDDPVLSSFDHGFQKVNGELQPLINSNIFSMGTTKQGMLKKTSKTITTEDFQLLLRFTERKLQEIQTQIMEGKISAEPYRNSNNGACDYCPYHSICRFDLRIEGNRHRELEELSDEAVLRKMAAENLL